jgi:hypothetical protein
MGLKEYETLKSSLPNFCSEVNELINKGSTLIDGEEVDLKKSIVCMAQKVIFDA